MTVETRSVCICDRCHEDIPIDNSKELREQVRRLDFYGGKDHTLPVNMDLCDPCAEQLKRWMKPNDSTKTALTHRPVRPNPNVPSVGLRLPA